MIKSPANTANEPKSMIIHNNVHDSEYSIDIDGYRALKMELNRLKFDKALIAKATREENERLRNELASVVAERDILRQRNELQNSKIENLEQSVREISKERDVIEKKHENLVALSANMSKVMDQYEQINIRLLEQNNKLQNELNNKLYDPIPENDQIEVGLDLLNTTTSEMTNACMERENLRATISQLRQNSQKAINDQDMMEKKQNDIMKLLTEMTNKMRDLRRYAALAKRQNSQLKSCNVRLNEEKSLLRSYCNELMSENDHLKA